MATPTNTVLDGKFLDPVTSLGVEVKSQKNFKVLIEEIKKYIPDFSENELKVTIAYQADVRTRSSKKETEEIVPVEWLELRNKENTVEINAFTFNLKDGPKTVYKGFIDTGAEDNNFKGYEVLDGEIVQIFSQEGKIGETSKPNLPHNPGYVPGHTVTAKLDWLDGRFCLEDEKNNRDYEHCGPGCGAIKNRIPGSGETPINGLDRCCQAHDRCWSVFGEGDNCCDKEIASCIDPFKSEDTATWYQINTYFQPQGWLC